MAPQQGFQVRAVSTDVSNIMKVPQNEIQNLTNQHIGLLEELKNAKTQNSEQIAKLKAEYINQQNEQLKLLENHRIVITKLIENSIDHLNASALVHDDLSGNIDELQRMKLLQQSGDNLDTQTVIEIDLTK